MSDPEKANRRSPTTVRHPLPASVEEERKRRIIEAARQQAEQPSNVQMETHHRRDSDTGSGRLAVRCPNCHEPTEVAVDTLLTDLTCSACGSHFSLVDQSQATRMAPSLSTMGRFELIERIGVGGFGSVWKARDKELDRTVAVKVPRQGGMSAEEQEKFFREARAAAQLRHPSIVSVHEVGRDGDSVYIVSDFVRGVTLGDWLTGQQLTSREAAELCAKIADALHHAHEQGVVHRDLKPANIMIDGDGQPHLMDFGLARREVGEVTVTIDGQVLGTPAYMSPEQAAGEAHTADRRSDVYSLGVILFQLLTGELPFRGNARMLVHQVINDLPPSPRKFNTNIPKDLETITLKCLEKESSRRYQSALDLANELRRYLARKPIHARPVGHVERAWRLSRRNPTVALLSAAVVLVLAVASTIGPMVAAYQASLRRAAESAALEAKLNRLGGLWHPIYLAYEFDGDNAGSVPPALPVYQYEAATILADLADSDEEALRFAALRAEAAQHAAEAMRSLYDNSRISVDLLVETIALKTRSEIAQFERRGDRSAVIGALATERNLRLDLWRTINALYETGRRGGEVQKYHLTAAQFAESHAKLLIAVEGEEDKYRDVLKLQPGLIPTSFDGSTPAQAFRSALTELQVMIGE